MNRWMDKLIIVYPYNASKKKTFTIATNKITDEPQSNFAEWEQPEKSKSACYRINPLNFFKNTNWPVRMRSQLVPAWGQRSGGVQWGGLREGMREARRKLGSAGDVHYIDHGDVSQAHTHIEMYQIVHFKYVWFLTCQLYLNEAVREQRGLWWTPA